MSSPQYILSIETSTEVCSVALVDKGEVMALKETNGVNQHSALVTVYVEQIVNETGISLDNIDAIAVSMGPGSYTGLRIGVSTAKGICYALDKPLIAIGTLNAMALKAKKYLDLHNLSSVDTCYCPMIDARRMEVYCSIFDQDLNSIVPVTAEIIGSESFHNYSNLWYFGTGAKKCREFLNSNPGLHYLDGIFPSAVEVAELAEIKYHHHEFENVAYFEPFYLKEFVAGLPKVKGLI